MERRAIPRTYQEYLEGKKRDNETPLSKEKWEARQKKGPNLQKMKPIKTKKSGALREAAREIRSAGVSPKMRHFLEGLIGEYIEETWTTATGAELSDAKANLRILGSRWEGGLGRTVYELATDTEIPAGFENEGGPKAATFYVSVQQED